MGFEIINTIKKEKGLTNAQIANMSGITLSTLDKITSGINKNPKLDTLQAICRVLGCTLNDFVDTPQSAKKESPLYSSEAEEQLITLHRKLNTEGQEKLLDYADDLVASGKYIKNDPNNLGKAKGT